MTAPAYVRPPAAPVPVVGGYPVAALGRRVGAFLIDDAIVIGIGLVLYLVFYGIGFGLLTNYSTVQTGLALLALGSFIVPVGLLVWTLFGWYAPQGTKGSIGMRALGLKLVRRADGSSPGMGPAIGRGFIFSLAGSIVVGYFSALFDNSGLNQGWHDKVIDAVVVDTKAGRPTASAARPTGAGAVPPVPPPARPSAVPPVPAVPGLAVPGAVPPPPAVPAPPAVPVAPVVSQPAWLASGLAAPESLFSNASSDLPDATVAAPRQPAAPGSPWGAETPAAAPHASPAVPVPPPPADASGLVSFVPGVSESQPTGVAFATPSVPQPPVPPVPPVRPVASEASRPPVAPTAAAYTVEPEEDLDETRFVPVRPASVEPRATLVWDDGTVHPVSKATLFGRNPDPIQTHDVVAVPDSSRSLSKTHFEVGFDDAGTWIVDRHSTNGVVRERAGSPRVTAVPGDRLRVADGDTIVMGDRVVTIRESR